LIRPGGLATSTEKPHAMYDPLIKAEELKSRLNEPNFKVFDIRGRWGNPPVSRPEEYLKGHIPGAFYLDWIETFLEPSDSIPEAPVASQKRAKEAFRQLGISSGDTVVLYDDYAHMFASRVWWSMNYWGFSQVKILNGGWERWLQSGHPTSTVPATPPQGDFVPVAQPHWLVSTEQVIAQKEESLLLDGRGEAGFREARIPGSLSLPFSTLLDPDTGLFKSSEDLEAVFESTGDWRERPIIATCGAGYAATVLMVALQKLGRSAPLYDGSLTIWKQDPSRPVEMGL
jgi:thiosulfate/3-mercaptopyruvate sulfurtransferase